MPSPSPSSPPRAAAPAASEVDVASERRRKRAISDSQRPALLVYEDSQRMEVEALQSIYLTDLTVLASVPSLTPTSPPLPCHLSLTILPEPLLDRERANHSILSLSIQYPTLSLPFTPPPSPPPPVKGLDSTLISEVTSLIHQQLDRLWEEDVGHDGVMVSLCAAVHEWLRVHNVESVSVHEEMKRREARQRRRRSVSAHSSRCRRRGRSGRGRRNSQRRFSSSTARRRDSSKQADVNDPHSRLYPSPR